MSISQSQNHATCACRAQACSICIFVASSGFFSDSHCVQLLKTAVEHKKPCLLVITPMTHFTSTPPKEESEKKPASQRLKTLVALASLPLWFVARIPKLGNMAKEAVDQLRELTGEREADVDEHDLPENACEIATRDQYSATCSLRCV